MLNISMLTIAADTMLAGLSHAVYVAPQNADKHGCAVQAQDLPIGVGDYHDFDTPMRCIFNTIRDPGFDMNVCSEHGGSGQCVLLSEQEVHTIDGYLQLAVQL
jgi:hypothetical protein